MTDKRILVIDREGHEESIDLLMEMEVPPAAYFAVRDDELENDESKLQIIPYIMIHDGFRVLSAKRTKKGGETRLRFRRSLGIGGHMEYADVWQNSFKRGAIREIQEETGIVANEIRSLEPVGHILLDINPVSRVHIGAAFTAKVLPGILEATVESNDGTGELELVAMEPNDVLNELHEYEEWSAAFKPFLEKLWRGEDADV